MGANMHDYIIHILTPMQWMAVAHYGMGYFERDNDAEFIHFSFPHQVVESANLHFEGEDEVLLMVCEAKEFGDKLKVEWVASRKEQMPHLYAPHFHDGDAVLRPKMTRGPNGRFEFPEELDAFLKG